MTRVLLAATAAALLSSTAYAADLLIPAPEEIYIAETSSWDGFYAGVNAGYGTAGLYLSDNEDDGTDLDGFIAGVQAGYNFQADNLVFGVEGDVTWSGISADGDDDDNDFTTDIDLEYLATLRGRVGFAADAFLIYGTAGVAFTSLDLPEEGYSVDHVGWVAGVGAEYLVTDSISVKAEYLYHDFGSEIYFEDDELDLDVQTVKVGLNFHF